MPGEVERVERREEVQPVELKQKEVVRHLVQKQWTEKDELMFLRSSFDIDSHAIHGFHKCRSQQCHFLNSAEKDSQKESVDRFQHSWIMDKKLSYSSSIGVNWLVYIEGQGMFCILFRKHGTLNHQNKSKKFNLDPAVRFKRKAVEDHANSQQHKAAIEGELLNRVSSFQSEINEINNSKDEVLYKTFLAMY